MRTTHISLLGAIALAALTACTVKDVDVPALLGPSTFVHSITLVADRDTLTQNGVDFTDIRVTSLSPTGQPENIPLRAQILVDGVAQDFGTLSTKTPITPATIRYTAPPALSGQAANVPQTITIEVTPTNNGDFRNEFARQVQIRLMPQGVILPVNPTLVPDFSFTPASPKAFEVVTFNASATTNAGTSCGQRCSYGWNFGDGTTGTGIITTHEYRGFRNLSGDHDGDRRTGRAGHCAQSGDRGFIGSSGDSRLYVLTERAGARYDGLLQCERVACRTRPHLGGLLLGLWGWEHRERRNRLPCLRG